MNSNIETISVTEFRDQVNTELMGNILPFWMDRPVDRVNGGFYGAITNDLTIRNEIPRSAILCARILWTFASAYRKFGAPEYLSTAQWAYDYLIRVFWDDEYGGVYWSVDYQGNPVQDRKHHYAQAFAIYGLSEYFRATLDQQSLKLAQDLFHLLEKHAYEPIYGGYIEGSSRTWRKLEDMRLSTKEMNCRKSMNTMLHILEAYTNLLRVWDLPELKQQHKALIETFINKIIDPQTHHFKLLFDDQWHSLIPHVSYGHDIEGSWLLVEAAEVQGDIELLAQVQEIATQMAAAVYRRGRDQDGSLFYEGDPQGVIEAYKSWWVQAEAMVGFYNAHQLSRQEFFAKAAQQCWAYIQTNLVDRTHGDWVKQRHPNGRIDDSIYKVGPWEGPYHHSRACFEILDRILA
jgi:mannobiose 2-epimerase